MNQQIISYPFLKIYGKSEKLRIKYLGKKKWEVEEDFTIHIDRVNQEITIPKGFVSDLGSVPSALRSFIPRTPELTLPSMIHDYLWKIRIFPRKIDDLIFKDYMKLTKVSKTKRNVMYQGVRKFGWVIYYIKKWKKR